MSLKRLLFSILIIVGVGVVMVNLSSAFFSDTETSAGNTFQAGSFDLLIDNTSYYNGELNDGTTWTRDDLGSQLFFNFLDIKPGDEGEDTISLRVDDNDAWACAELSLTSNDDVSSTTPELDEFDNQEEGDNDFDGELAQLINFIFWVDDGDNVLEQSEYDNNVLAEGLAFDILNLAWVLADSTTNNVGGSAGEGLKGLETYYVGKAWCYGNLTPDPVQGDLGEDPTVDPGIDCDGSSLTNISQTDSITADIEFIVEQHRNNPDFECESKEPLFIEELFIDSTNTSTTESVNSLTNEKIYILEVTGTYTYWPTCPDFAPCVADAEYSLRPSSSFGPGWVIGEGSFITPYGLDLRVDGVNIFWGAYTGTHTYKSFYTGDGSTASFSIYDSFYGDNSGGLTVKIYEKP